MAELKKTILVVDDDSDLLDQMKIRLESKGFDVISALGQKEALRVIEERPFDLAIVDLMMEYKDSGFILSYKIKQKDANKPVIIMSSAVHELNLHAQVSSQPERAWLKADAAVQKGVRFEILLAEVHRLLGMT